MTENGIIETTEYKYDGLKRLVSEKETGTIYLRARNYNPAIGRFTSRDGFAGQIGDPLSLNRYTYCHNNPIIYMDNNGDFVILGAIAIGAAVGGLISGGAKVIKNVHDGKDWHDGVAKATLSGAVSGAISAIPIPGVGPL